MRLALALITCLMASPAPAQDLQPLPQDFAPLPLHDAARLVTDRYHGRLIAARLTLPTAHEDSLGVDLVRELRLLTPQGNLLTIRLDARGGRFLDVAGIGQTEARR